MKTTPALAAHITRITQDPRWAALLARDPAFDDRFVYAVRTTGVYAHPSSPARHPRPENVVFFDTPADAQAAGFRPSQRAVPDQTRLAQQHAVLVAAACRQLHDDPTTPLSQLAAIASLTPSHFHRVFKASTGLTPRQYAGAHRAARLRTELDRQSPVLDAVFEAGFGASSRVYEQSDHLLGMTPATYRSGAVDMNIHFAIGQCSLGALLVARTARGLCAITLGDDPRVLVRDLQDRFPQATLIGADHDFEQWVAQVVGLVEAPARGLELPLDIQGTAFQQRVWEALRQIPPGTTRTYAQIAKAIGQPTASRAVAAACAANPVAVAIPCHRVVRTDGGLSGYRWGVERKRALLDREQPPTPLPTL